jgi:hypothetical protein
VGKIVRGEIGQGDIGEGKDGLIESNVARYEDAVRVEIETPIATMLSWIADEDAWNRSWF